jgi:hypothetical protein
VTNIEVDFGEIEWRCVDWIGLAQDRYKWRVLVNLVMNHQAPQNVGKPSGLTAGGLLSGAQLHRVS